MLGRFPFNASGRASVIWYSETPMGRIVNCRVYSTMSRFLVLHKNQAD